MKTIASLLISAACLHAEPPVETFQAPDKTHYQAQDSVENTLTLTPNNGFFDRGPVRATGPVAAPPADKPLIRQHFKNLIFTQPQATARWHLYFTEPGNLKISSDLTPSEPATWKVTIAGSTHQLDSDKPLEINIPKPGKHTLELTRTAPAGAGAGIQQLKSLTLTGPAIQTAKLLRTRWRPAAVHTSYSSSTCPTTKLWVFESQSITPHSNYSPMTTPFGYFGATFNADKKAAGGVNFSMWSAGSKAEKAPPLATSPRIIATGNPKATFGGFGHEGSGVKIRDWTPYAHHPTSVIQALRLETEDGLNTYHGYLYHQPSQKWILYASGQKPHTKKRFPTTLRATSFCEIPGPPSRERTGDQPRIIRRRGWFLDEDKTWHPVDQIHFRNNNQPSSKTIGSQPGGWLTMGTGGIDMHIPQTTVKITPPKQLPPYLTPEKTKQLFTLPATFGTNTASEITSTSATITYNLEDAGTNPTAILYYGTKDAITSIPRKFHGTENKGVSKKMLAPDRVWQSNTRPASIEHKQIQFHLENLTPNTTYHHRILITNDQGKTWHPTTSKFTTTP